jgi:hypothetical protein
VYEVVVLLNVGEDVGQTLGNSFGIVPSGELGNQRFL